MVDNFQKIRIGLIGFGYVGRGVFDILGKNNANIQSRIGHAIEIKTIVVRDLQKHRDVPIGNTRLSTNIRDVLDDPEIDIVVEVIGGEMPAYDIIREALMKKKWGRVIHISSISATHGEAHTNKVAYASSKAYLNSYLKGLSQLIAHKKIIFSGVMPGPLLTKGKFWEQQSKKNPSKVKKYLENNFAIRRFGKENEICPFILLLASKHASYASGTIIPIDGGKY